MSLYLSRGNVLIRPLILRTTHSMKRKRGAISSKEICNRVRKKTYPWLRFQWSRKMYCGTCVGSSIKHWEISKSELGICHRNRQFPFGSDKESWKCSSRIDKLDFHITNKENKQAAEYQSVYSSLFHLWNGRIFPNSLGGLFFRLFFLGGGGGASGLSLWASDIFSSLAHCLVSKKGSVEHWFCKAINLGE